MKFKIQELKEYTIIPNEYLKDKKISLKAKGLLTIMYSLQNEWDYTMNGLCIITGEGITKIRNAIWELETFGYLKREQTKDEKGRFQYYYIVYLKSQNIGTENTISNKRKKIKKTRFEDLCKMI